MILQTIDPENFVKICLQVDLLAQTGLSPDPFISGNDLMAFGMNPGPAFKIVLEGVYDAQLEGTVSDKKSAIDLAKSIFATLNSDEYQE